MLPLFVPPVATGLILLMLFGRSGPLGSTLDAVSASISSSPGARSFWPARSCPFHCSCARAQSAFQEVNPRFENIARTLGASEWRVFRTISLPLALRGIVAGAVLAFARAMGEFGATAIVAGMIPRKTMTISLAIYQNMQLGQDAAALPLLLVSIAIVFVTVFCGQMISKRKRRR